MEADIHILYKSDFYRILDFRCRCMDCRTSKPEYNEAFCISFVRKGNFLFNTFRRSIDSYTGCVLITKPEYERTVTHTHEIPDECTILEFNSGFYKKLLEQYVQTKFFTDNDWHSAMVKTTAETEFFHFYILQQLQKKSADRLHMDLLVLETCTTILDTITEYQPDKKINYRLKKNHLITIERAKEYITQNFTEDISLTELATYCYVSPFHFSRIFKTFTFISPHQFLLTVRLKNAELLLRTTQQPVADIAFSSGFKSIEHFTAAFRQRYKCAPSLFRSGKSLNAR